MVWALPRSLATTCGIIFIFFSYGYLDVSVPHVRSSYEVTDLQSAGLPHSEIKGSKIICISPLLIAAYHVLHRLREPRHPPSALAYFLFSGHLREPGLIYLQLALVTLFYVVHHVKDLLYYFVSYVSVILCGE